MANGAAGQLNRPGGISRVPVGFAPFQAPQPTISENMPSGLNRLFEAQANQPNMFQTFAAAMQMRQENERAERANAVEAAQAEQAILESKAKTQKLLKETQVVGQQPNFIDQLRNLQSNADDQSGFDFTGFTVDDEGSVKASFGTSPERKQEIGRVGDAKKDLDKFATDATQSINAIGKIGRLAENLGEFERGFLNQLGARTKFAIDEFSQDENVAKFVGGVSQELIPAARKIMEEKGPITESDVNRVEKGLGEKTAPLSTKIELLTELLDKIELSLNQKTERAGISQDEFAQQFGVLFNQLQQTRGALNSILQRSNTGSVRKSVRNRDVRLNSDVKLKRLGLDPSKFEIVE